MSKTAGEAKVRKLHKELMDSGETKTAQLIARVANLLSPSIKLGGAKDVAADGSGVSLSGADTGGEVDMAGNDERDYAEAQHLMGMTEDSGVRRRMMERAYEQQREDRELEAALRESEAWDRQQERQRARR